MRLFEILKDSNYDLSLFSNVLIQQFEDSIFTKETKAGNVPYIKCVVRNKDIKLTPEEAIRQLYLLTLNQQYQYPYSRMQLEYAVHFGREVKRADIVIMDKIQPTVPYIIVEVKKPKLKEPKRSLLKLLFKLILN